MRSLCDIFAEQILGQGIRRMISTLKQNFQILLFSSFIIFIFSLSFILIPYSDSYYYLDWSKHLAWGYYDGPPFIAYCMRLFRFIFGDNIVAINLIGVTTIIIIAYYIYQTATILFNKTIAKNAVLLWMLSTPVFHYLFLWVTYDNLLCLFWSAAIYHVIRYIKNQNHIDLYIISIFLACMLLAKYTGFILITAIFIFIVSTPFRYLFREKHFYFAIGLLFILISPHLYWNYQHHWQTFIYLFARHVHDHSGGIIYFLIKILKTLDVLLILPIYGWLRCKIEKSSCHASVLSEVSTQVKELVVPRLVRGIQKARNIALDPADKPRDDGCVETSVKACWHDMNPTDTSILLLHIINITFLFFLFLMSFKNSISKHWLTPFTMSSAILASYYFEKFALKKLFFITLLLYTIWGFYYLTVNSIFQRYFDEDFFRYRLIEKAKKTYHDKNIVTSDWETAAKLSFWLGKNRVISTLPCGNENQYAEWKKPLRTKEILYIDFNNRITCIKKFFDYCEANTTLKKSSTHIGYLKTEPPITLFIYRCGNSHNPPPIKI